MAQARVLDIRSYSQISFLVNQALQMNGTLQAADAAEHIIYEITGAIWQMARPRPHDMRGAILERYLSDGRVIEFGFVNERLLAMPELTLYRLQIRMARTCQGILLDFDPMYEKVLLVPTSEYLAAAPRPRPSLTTFHPAVVQAVRQFVRAHCEPYRHWDRVHADFHTCFHHSDTPAISVASPYDAMLAYVEQNEDDFTGPLNEAAEDARIARSNSSDPDNFDGLDFINRVAENLRGISDVLPEDIIAAYIARRYRIINTVHLDAQPLDPPFAQLYRPVDDAEEEIFTEGEPPGYIVDEDTMMEGGVEPEIMQYEVVYIVADT